jgi:hypothetical protein
MYHRSGMGQDCESMGSVAAAAAAAATAVVEVVVAVQGCSDHPVAQAPADRLLLCLCCNCHRG